MFFALSRKGLLENGTFLHRTMLVEVLKLLLSLMSAVFFGYQNTLQVKGLLENGTFLHRTMLVEVMKTLQGFCRSTGIWKHNK